MEKANWIIKERPRTPKDVEMNRGSKEQSMHDEWAFVGLCKPGRRDPTPCSVRATWPKSGPENADGYRQIKSETS
jgi:hypothetical protein